MEDNSTVKTSLAAVDVTTDDSFLDIFTMYELCVDRYVQDKKRYSTMTEALVALRSIFDGKFRYAISEAAGTGHSCVYILFSKSEDPPIRNALKGTCVSCRLLHSANQVPTENICDLAVKYAVLKKELLENVLQRDTGIWYKYSEKMALHICFRNTEGIPGRVAICAEGSNIKKTTKTTGKPFPFTFSPEGILIYPPEDTKNIQRYIWNKRSKTQKLTKVRAITFGNERDYKASQSKLRYMNEFLRLLNETHGIYASPITWEGTRYKDRIGKPIDKYARINKAAVRVAMENGISIQAGEGIALYSAVEMERYMEILFSYIYKAKFHRCKASYIRVRGEGIIAIKTAKKMFFPEQDENGWAWFDMGENGKNVSGITAYTNIKTESLEVVLYGEDGLVTASGTMNLVEMTEKSREKKQEELAWSTGESPVREDGKFVLKVIRSKGKEVPYERSLEIQHITEGVIADNTDSLIPMCKNLVYQMIIKNDIREGKFTFMDMSGFAGYEFILGVREEDVVEFASMKITEDGGFVIGKPLFENEIRFRAMEDMKSGEHYAIKPPEGDIAVIQDTGYTIMTDPSFSGENATRAKVEENRMLAPFLDFILYEREGRKYYSAGWDLVDSNSQGYTYIPKIRCIKVWQDKPFAMEMDDFFSLMNVPFVWMAQKNTVVPFPFKYLREYIGTLLAKAEETNTEEEIRKKTR